MTAPVISPDELASFHAKHFSSHATDHFALHFLGPVEEEEYVEEWEDDDGLGYYEDGKKRTLTNKQIAIFRHSEIQALLREQRHAAEAKDDESPIEAATPIIGLRQPGNGSRDVVAKPVCDEGELEDGELDESATDAPKPTPQSSNNQRPFSKSKAKKAERGKQRGYFKQHSKPDLRKRTWDVVDEGLGSLDYDEGSSSTVPMHAAQRRRISYDDD